MTSQSKFDSNRANAQHSTGPRTEAGKAASSRNAVTHGLFSATFAVAPADRDEFDLFHELQREELRPQGVNEEIVFANLVQAAWKTEIIRRLESQALAEDPEQNEAKLDRLSRYATRFERAYYRALAELRKLQTERALREATVPTAESAPLADPAKVKKQTQTPPDPDGLDPYIRRLAAEASWTNAQLRALRQGMAMPAPAPPPEAAI